MHYIFTIYSRIATKSKKSYHLWNHVPFHNKYLKQFPSYCHLLKHLVHAWSKNTCNNSSNTNSSTQYLIIINTSLQHATISFRICSMLSSFCWWMNFENLYFRLKDRGAQNYNPVGMYDLYIGPVRYYELGRVWQRKRGKEKEWVGRITKERGKERKRDTLAAPLDQI